MNFIGSQLSNRNLVDLFAVLKIVGEAFVPSFADIVFFQFASSIQSLNYIGRDTLLKLYFLIC
jgi:hypothetical protein